MPRLLHILTEPPDPVVQEILSREKRQPGAEVTVVDLTQPEPDYTALLEEIFAADSIAVW